MAVVSIAVVSIAVVSIVVVRIAVVSIAAVSIAEQHHVMRLQCSNLQLSCGSISACHAAPVWHSGSQHCGCQHCGSQHCGAASCHVAPLLCRVEMKIFVFVFPWKVLISFENTNLFAKTKNFMKKKIFGKTYAKAKMFAKSENDSAPCDYGSTTLLSDIAILCNFNMLMKSEKIFSRKYENKNFRFNPRLAGAVQTVTRAESFSWSRSLATLRLRFRLHPYVQDVNISKNKNC
jgi:hypothetical protein